MTCEFAYQWILERDRVEVLAVATEGGSGISVIVAVLFFGLS